MRKLIQFIFNDSYQNIESLIYRFKSCKKTIERVKQILKMKRVN